ncbi:MAG: hypothetical protein HOK63_03480 [Thaumarchaeota archaeon]|jgi:hypothetical protein|nr:hypothetical protein [Nitrososphaerota archaeon]MBT6468698.1 hypothetical protein [Nitrososphaerota archaeon]
MAIKSASEYVNFYLDLNMGEGNNLERFANNEKMVLKIKLENKNMDKVAIKKGIEILEELVKEIKENGEKFVLEKYQNN